MVFSNTTNLNGIIQEIERLTDVGQTYFSSDSTRLKEVTATVNRINHRVLHLIAMSTGNWQYDDGNYTDLPTSVTDLISGQSRYSLPIDALTLQRLECKDPNGNWYKLKPITKELINSAVGEFLKTNGNPEYYTLLDNVIELFPATNYNSTEGLKAYFDRDSVDFLTTDTTKTPGFSSTYHEIIPIKASIEWLKVKQPQSPTLAILIQDDLKLEDNIKKFYAKKFKDYKPKIGRLKENFK